VKRIYDVLLDPYHFADYCESALLPEEIQSRGRRNYVRSQYTTVKEKTPTSISRFNEGAPIR
jgi:hypothetical protein